MQVKHESRAAYEADRKRRWRAANRDATRDRENEYYQGWAARLKTAVFDHYGQSCACCGSAENLSIDHVGGDGKSHRLELFGVAPKGGQQRRMYRWLLRNGFPEGFQTLCVPCNTSKSNRERCGLNHGGAR